MPTLTPATKHFVRHYLEMVVAMFAGMVVLGIPLEAGLHAIGSSTSDLHHSAPAVVLLGMAATMTVPMVALMRLRGHAWRPCWEMSASMFLPTFAAIALMGSGLIGFGLAMTLEHVVMLPAMLVAMLLRPEEYSGHGHSAHDRSRGAAVEAVAS
jgi:hypothetical protein